jgi:hypothetical protein
VRFESTPPGSWQRAIEETFELAVGRALPGATVAD